uniref:Uncharacterized protein n=1 Tax=Arundo donax TaxID=35708 RepID=A0A0A9FNA9_ARUDO
MVDVWLYAVPIR